MTQLEIARKGQISIEMEKCAAVEGVLPEFIRKGIEEGTIVLTCNKVHHCIQPLAIGKGLRTKVNANIGTSKDRADVVMELKKLQISSIPWATL